MHQEQPQIRNDDGERSWRGSHPLTGEECAALCRLRSGKVIAETNWHIGHECRAASFERAAHGSGQLGLTQFERLRNQPQIIEILVPTMAMPSVTSTSNFSATTVSTG